MVLSIPAWMCWIEKWINVVDKLSWVRRYAPQSSGSFWHISVPFAEKETTSRERLLTCFCIWIIFWFGFSEIQSEPLLDTCAHGSNLRIILCQGYNHTVQHLWLICWWSLYTTLSQSLLPIHAWSSMYFLPNGLTMQKNVEGLCPPY